MCISTSVKSSAVPLCSRWRLRLGGALLKPVRPSLPPSRQSSTLSSLLLLLAQPCPQEEVVEEEKRWEIKEDALFSRVIFNCRRAAVVLM